MNINEHFNGQAAGRVHDSNDKQLVVFGGVWPLKNDEEDGSDFTADDFHGEEEVIVIVKLNDEVLLFVFTFMWITFAHRCGAEL